MKQFLLLLIFLSSSFILMAQNKYSPERITKIEAGYIFGGTLKYHYLASSSGPTVGFFHGKKLSSRFNLLGGMAFEKLTDRNILPVMVDMDYFNKKGNQFFNFRMGYAHAWKTQNETDTTYNYKGGWSYSMGYGFQFLEKEDWKLNFMLSYNFRDTKLVYEIEPENIKYEDASNLHLLSLKLCFVF